MVHTKNTSLMRKNMKQLLLLNIILAALSAPAQAASVNAYATDVIGTYGSFSQTPGGTALNEGQIESTFNSNEASVKASKPPASITSIYGLPVAGAVLQDDWVAIDIGFGNKTVVTGSGVDLVVLSLSSGDDYTFGLQAFGNDGTLLSSYNYDTAVNSNIYSSGILQTTIDLFDNNSAASALADDIELGYIRLFIGNGFNGGTNAYSNLSLVGAFHTQTAVVPLPLPIILFSSGLVLLGWIGRRKTT